MRLILKKSDYFHKKKCAEGHKMCSCELKMVNGSLAAKHGGVLTAVINVIKHNQT